MKIIVDEMPKNAKDCIFSCCTNPFYGHHSCDLWQGRGCEPSKCSFLKPITDFHVERIVQKNDDGSYISQSFDIR